MHSRYLTCFLMIVLLACSPMVTLSRPAGLIQTPGSQSASADQQKLKDEQKALNAKALALLRQIVAESSNLGVGENRIRVQLTASALLWPFDDKKARELISSAAAQLAQLTNEAGSGEPTPEADNELAEMSQFRREIVLTAAAHDPELALTLLEETKMPQSKSRKAAQLMDPDYAIEIALANQIANTSPQKAFQIADQDVKAGSLPFDLNNLLNSLNQAEDNQYAGKLAADMNAAIQGMDLGADQQIASVAFGLLTQAIQSDAPDAGSGNSNSGQAGAPKQALLGKEEITALIEKISSYAMDTIASAPQRTMEWNNARQMLINMTENVPNLAQYDPQAGAAMSQKLAANPNPVDANNQIWANLNQLMSTGTVQDILTAAEKAPPSVRYNFYQQAIQKAANDGDIDQARQLINQHIPDPVQRNQTLDAIGQNAVWRDIQSGKVESALDLIAKTPGPEQQCSMLVQLAESQSIKDRDKKIGLGILEQARALLPAQIRNYSQMQLLIRLGGAYSAYDANRGLSLISQAASRLNSLLTAAVAMEGFDLQGNFKDGELMLLQPRTQLTTMLQAYGQQLGELAVKDFDGVVAACSSLDREDARIFAELLIIGRVLQSDDSPAGTGHGGSIGGVVVHSVAVSIRGTPHSFWGAPEGPRKV